MSKNRTLPFGYAYENGEVVRNQEEARAVAHIFELYILGKSLSEIPEMLTIPFNGEDSKWDKHKVKRVLENKTYIGEGTYPQIIRKEDFDHVARIIASKRGNKVVLSDELQAIRDKAYCHHCGRHICRKLDRHKKETWICYECYYGYKITDDIILSISTALLNILIANPSLAENNEDKPYTPTDEIIRREQNISNSLASSTVDANEIIKAIMLNAEKKYDCCSYDDTAEITKKIKEKLTEHTPLKSFDLMLFEEIVEEIQPDIGCSIYMKLKNGAIIQHAIKRGENDERRS